MDDDRSISMDTSVPVGISSTDVPWPEASSTETKLYKIGDHFCIVDAGGTCMACRDCKSYITSYKKEKRSNLGTLKKQPCRPKTKGQSKREGRAPNKQKGGALPAPPPRTKVSWERTWWKWQTLEQRLVLLAKTYTHTLNVWSAAREGLLHCGFIVDAVLGKSIF
eukprot:625984-Amphidinium_carterae.1